MRPSGLYSRVAYAVPLGSRHLPKPASYNIPCSFHSGCCDARTKLSPRDSRLRRRFSRSKSSQRKPFTRRNGASSTRSPPPSARCLPTLTPSPRSAPRACSSTPGASILAGGKSSVEWATFVNGLLIRYLDFNDTYLSKDPHTPATTWPRCSRSARRSAPAGRDLITAAVLAYEIQCRFCDAASLRKHGVDHVTYGAISSATRGREADAPRRNEARAHDRACGGVQRRAEANPERRTEHVEGLRVRQRGRATACSPQRSPQTA